MTHSLADLASRFGLELQGDGSTRISGVCPLDPGRAGCLTFLANPRFRKQLETTKAAAVVVTAKDAAGFSGNGLIAKDPYLAYARIAKLFDPRSTFTPGVHPSASVADGVHIPSSAHVGPQCVIEEGVEIGENTFIGPACVVRGGARVGAGSRLEARVYVGEGVRMGERARVEPGAVIGGRGFGLARGPDGWEEVPQLGSVTIGNDVEIGANTTVDRGAIDDTVLEDGVKIDNQCQVAHNVRIGAHTAIAACVGIAGSVRIGARCMIGGAAGISGHIEIADDVVVLGFTMITASLREPGQYGSGIPAQPAREWRRSVGDLRRLPRLRERLDEVERRLGIRGQQGDEGGSEDD